MATRRKFLSNCSALAVSAAFFPASAMPATLRGREVSLADVSYKTLAAQVGSSFVLRDPSGGLQAIELLSAERVLDRDDASGETGVESFSLFFRGDVRRPLGQDTYSFEHARIGRFDMFIVPIGCEDRTRCYYEAVFNRLTPESPARRHGFGRRLVR